MTNSGDCVEAPSYLQSLLNCNGEYLGEERLNMHYTDLTAGDCLFPNFEIVEEKYPGNRYVYIDELLNDWFFESQLKLFMFFQDLDEN